MKLVIFWVLLDKLDFLDESQASTSAPSQSFQSAEAIEIDYSKLSYNNKKVMNSPSILATVILAERRERGEQNY